MFTGLPGSLQTYCVCLSCFHVICTTRFIFTVLQLCSYHWTFVSAQRPSEVSGSKPAQGLHLLTYLQNWGLYFYKKLLNWDTVIHSSLYLWQHLLWQNHITCAFQQLLGCLTNDDKTVTFSKGLLMGVWGIDLCWLWNRNSVPSKKDLGVTERCRQLTLLFILYLGNLFFSYFTWEIVRPPHQKCCSSSCIFISAKSK